MYNPAVPRYRAVDVASRWYVTLASIFSYEMGGQNRLYFQLLKKYYIGPKKKKKVMKLFLGVVIFYQPFHA